MVAISPAGRQARDAALTAVAPLFAGMLDEIPEEKVRAMLPLLRELRGKLDDER